jgi:sulfur carrier protein
MIVSVNGKEEIVDDGLTISQLLQKQAVKMPEMVSVELNGNILDRDAFATTQLQANDQVEFLYFMGGGK